MTDDDYLIANWSLLYNLLVRLPPPTRKFSESRWRTSFRTQDATFVASFSPQTPGKETGEELRGGFRKSMSRYALEARMNI